MKQKTLKIIRNLKDDGLLHLFKKYQFFLQLKKGSDIFNNKYNRYIVKKIYRKDIFAQKQKKCLLLTEYSYYYNNGCSKYALLSNELNNRGYLVDYNYLTENNSNYKIILPLVSHKLINKNDDYKNYDIIINDLDINLNNKSIYIKNDYFDKNDKFSNEEKIIDELNLIAINNNKIKNIIYNKLSIIVLNYNNINVIDKCIDSLLKYNNEYNYEIIVVDNQSTDGSYELLKQKYKKKIKLYQNDINGCSSGRNLGVSKSNKKYIMFLDSDQWIVHSNWLDDYLSIILKDSNIGAIGWAAGWFNKKGFASLTTDYFPLRYMPPTGLYRRDIGYLGTGGMLLERKIFNEIEGFDVNYDPTGYEDTDISLKIRDFGKEIVYCPYLGIKHLPHQTTKSGSEFYQKLIEKNGNYFVKKWKVKNSKLLNYIK